MRASSITPQTVFRGSSPGVEVGPYLSQFMLIGNTDVLGGSVRDGLIRYGVLQIDQRVPVATEGRDYMQCMADYVAVQRGLRPTTTSGCVRRRSPRASSWCAATPPRPSTSRRRF